MFFKGKQVLGLLLQGVLRWCLGGREGGLLCQSISGKGDPREANASLFQKHSGLDLSLFFLTSLV